MTNAWVFLIPSCTGIVIIPFSSISITDKAISDCIVKALN